MSRQARNKTLQRQEEVNLNAGQHLQPGLPRSSGRRSHKAREACDLLGIRLPGSSPHRFSRCRGTAMHRHAVRGSASTAGRWQPLSPRDGAPPAPPPLTSSSRRRPGRAPAAAADLRAPFRGAACPHERQRPRDGLGPLGPAGTPPTSGARGPRAEATEPRRGTGEPPPEREGGRSCPPANSRGPRHPSPPPAASASAAAAAPLCAAPLPVPTHRRAARPPPWRALPSPRQQRRPQPRPAGNRRLLRPLVLRWAPRWGK